MINQLFIASKVSS